MSARSLRREIVQGYTTLLLVALTLFAAATYLILAQSLSRTATASLRQTAAAAEQLIIPGAIPRIAVREDRVAPGRGDVEALRRRTRLATGEVVDIYVARTGDVEAKALRAFTLIALVLIPLTGLAAAFGGRSVADRILLPLNQLVEASREIGIGRLSRRVVEPEEPAELRELALALNAMLERLDGAVGALRRFTADASHELRTPLTAIRGTIEVALSRERSASELRETLQEVQDETRSMLYLVEDLLSLARAEERTHRLVTRSIDLVSVLEDVREMGEALAVGKPVEVRLDAPPELHVHGAPDPLRRLLVNLVSNAVKFTDRGTVLIQAKRLGGPPGGVGTSRAVEATSEWVEVSVRDTGRGIAEEDLPYVFERFYRADAAREQSGGSGLGLAIARMIAEQHGGTIEAESASGAGATFRLRLPA